MKESGLGTPGHPRRDDRAAAQRRLHPARRQGAGRDDQGQRDDRAAGHPPLTSAELTGSWEKRLSEIEHGAGRPQGVHGRHRQLHRRRSSTTSASCATMPIGACPNGDGDVIENRSAYGCSSYKSKKRARLRVHHLEEPGRVPHHPRGRAQPCSSRERRCSNRKRRARLVLGRRQRGRDRGRGRQAPDLIRRRSARAPTATATSARTGPRSAAPPRRRKKEPGCGFTIWKCQGAFTITADDVQRLLEHGRGGRCPSPTRRQSWFSWKATPCRRRRGRQAADRRRHAGAVPERRRRDQGEPARLRLHVLEVARATPAAGSRSGRASAGSRSPPSRCGRCWSTGSADLDDGPQPAKLVLDEGNQPQIVGADGAPLVRAARAAAPKREDRHLPPLRRRHPRATPGPTAARRGRASKNPGCGFVIWKSTKGREILPDDAKAVIEHGRIGPLDFRDRRARSRATWC